MSKSIFGVEKIKMPIKLMDIFKKPTIKEQAKLIQSMKSESLV
jgi:hypothetical protein